MKTCSDLHEDDEDDEDGYPPQNRPHTYLYELYIQIHIKIGFSRLV